MELRICPGIGRMYRLALIDGDEFTALSEHDTPEEACAAKLRAAIALAKARADLADALSPRQAA